VRETATDFTRKIDRARRLAFEVGAGEVNLCDRPANAAGERFAWVGIELIALGPLEETHATAAFGRINTERQRP
jgi:hypothetical protein